MNIRAARAKQELERHVHYINHESIIYVGMKVEQRMPSGATQMLNKQLKNFVIQLTGMS